MMDSDIYKNPHLQSGFDGDEEADPVVSSGPPVREESLPARENRGRRAPREGSGAVIGSGAGAGGGGNPEEFDADPQGGGGAGLSRSTDHRSRREGS